MRQTWLLVVMGCGSPRDRECRLMLPRLDEAEISTSIVANARPDATHAFAMLAARSAAASRWLESTSLQTEELRHELPALLQALEHHGDAAKRADAALHALGFHITDAGVRLAPTVARIYAPGSPTMDEALTLGSRCGFVFATRTELPECTALAACGAHFLAPTEGVTASAHVATFLAELSAVHSQEARVEGALRSLESPVRDVVALLVASTVDGPATTLVAQLRALVAAVAEQHGAHKAVAERAAAMRAMCTRADKDARDTAGSRP